MKEGENDMTKKQRKDKWKKQYCETRKRQGEMNGKNEKERTGKSKKRGEFGMAVLLKLIIHLLLDCKISHPCFLTVGISDS